jgi:serine/threonine protein kinase
MRIVLVSCLDSSVRGRWGISLSFSMAKQSLWLMAEGDSDADPVSEGESTHILTGLYPGRKLGADRYSLLKRLGHGGAGEVWLATDTVLSEPSALKLLPPAKEGDAAAFEDLRQETRRSRRLSHPNIIRIYDFHNLPGEIPFISMEFVKGVNLDALREREPQGVLSWEFLRPILRLALIHI